MGLNVPGVRRNVVTTVLLTKTPPAVEVSFAVAAVAIHSGHTLVMDIRWVMKWSIDMLKTILRHPRLFRTVPW